MRGSVAYNYLCYNNDELIKMSTQVDQLIKEAQMLSIEELQLLCKVILRQLAVPPQEPEKIYDDWNDPEVDAITVDTW
jgi:hypothetical protein